MYGTRDAYSRLSDEDFAMETNAKEASTACKNEMKESEHPVTTEKKSFKDRLIISSENKFKSFFDVWVLVLVGYSCITSMYYVAFNKPTNKLQLLWDDIVEYHFYVDIILSFFCEFKNPDTNLIERGFKKIAINYLQGWFVIDFVSIFPFYWFIPSGSLTKLFRIFRIPRLIKLIDVDRVKNILRSL